MAADIFSEDCICTALCGATLGTFTLRKLECSRDAVVANTLAWNNKIGRVAYIVGWCAMGNDKYGSLEAFVFNFHGEILGSC